MKIHLTWLTGILRRILILLLLYLICRLLFLLFNYSMFPGIGIAEFISVFTAGVMFDISAIILLNAPYILFSLLPLKARHHKGYLLFLRHLFIWPNIFALLLNLADIGYYPFTLKRSTFDLFHFVGKEVEFFDLLPSFLTGYWYLLFLLLMFTWALWFLEKKSSPRQPGEISTARYTGIHTFILILSLPVFTLFYRGGLQLKPIHMVDAGRFTEPRYIPLVLNTTFTVLKTIESGSIKEIQYLSPEECLANFDPVTAPDSGAFQKKNVVIIILESFSKEYSAFFSGKKGYTPFLDSLASRGAAFMNAYANGHRSIEALPAIISGLPSLMDEPYITSPYAGNELNSLPTLLKKKGYETSFFHGARNGSMGFDSYARIAGFEHYYGMNEYNNEKDADGHWGIWDRPFFRFFSQKLSAQKQPFFSTIFSLSSHHPFRLPDNEKFPEGGQPIHKTIAYADDVLREFFRVNRNAPWFANTVFVLVADHTGPDDPGTIRNRTSTYKIPLILYDPSDTIGVKITRITQQADIMATLFDKLDHDQPFYSFGKSAFRPHGNMACWQGNGLYSFILDSILYEFNGESIVGKYDLVKDPAESVNLAEQSLADDKKALLFIKAFLQRYNHDMIHNELRIK